jgi:hypothetical protein
MGMTVRQGIYAALAVAGVIATGYFNLQFMAEHGGFDISTFIAGGYANPAAASLSADLTVAFAAFLFWLPAEAHRVGVRHWWIYVLLSCTVAFAFAYPLFLFVRERKLAAQAA